jgi:hypothetical protein
MLSGDDAPPIVEAHVGTNVNQHDSVDAGVNSFVDNYDLMGGGGGNFDEYSLSEQMVHFCGGFRVFT